MGDLDYFHGVKVKKLPNGALLCQTKYIRDLLAKAHIADAKALPTSMTSSCKLTKFGGDNNQMDGLPFVDLRLTYPFMLSKTELCS